MKKLVLFAALCAVTGTFFGMDKEQVSIQKIVKKDSLEQFFIKTYHLSSKLFDLYRFQLSTDDNIKMEENANTIAAALIACEKEIPGEEAATCELMRLEVIDKKKRNKGYGSFLINHIVDYMTKYTNAQELGLLAEPSAENSYQAENESVRVNDLLRIDSFYKKNGFKEVEGVSGAFVFNLRDNKI